MSTKRNTSDSFVFVSRYISPQLETVNLILQQSLLVGSGTEPDDPEETDI